MIDTKLNNDWYEEKKNDNNSLAQNVSNCSLEPIIININMGGGAIINIIFISLLLLLLPL